MGDEIDTFNLPLHQSQSGNQDAGHMSSLADNILTEQAGQLNTAVESYYSGSHDFHRLRENLADLGYTDERVQSISQSAYQELQFRDENHGTPSNLTPNQLIFLNSQHDPSGRGIAINLNYRHLHTDENGRQYIDDNRVRNVDGTPSKLYLPEPIQFDPLTGEQVQEVAELRFAEDSVFITEDADTGETIQLTDNQREEVMYLATQYLNSDPDFRIQQRLQFRNNVQQIQGLSSVDNIREDLFELFIDIEDEYDYRQNNNGVPRGLSGRQYDYLRHQSGTYYGQPILLEQESGLNYYYSERGKTPIPTDREIEQIGAGQVDYTDIDITPTTEDYNNLNDILTNYITGFEDEEQALRDIERLAEYRPNDPEADPRRRDIYSEYFTTFQIAQREKEFREINNGRPSQLSELQYEYLINHSLIDDREERYVGQPIFTHSDGHLTYRMSNGTNLEIPSDEYIEGFIEQGIYTRPVQEPERNIQLDDETLPDFRNQRIITAIGQDRYNNLTPEQIQILLGVVNRKGDLVTTYDSFNIDYVEPTQQVIFTEPGEPRPAVEDILTDLAYGGVNRPGEEQLVPSIFQEGSGDPPVLPGQTQPVNLRTGEDIPADSPESNVLRYQQYFNDNQSLFYGFREMFRDILPVLSAGAGGYMTYLYKSSRSFNKLRTILSEEEQLLNDLENRLRSEALDLSDKITRLNSLQEGETIQRGAGYNLLRQLNIRRGQLAGLEDDPDQTEDLTQLVRTASNQLQNSNDELRQIIQEVETQKQLVFTIEDELVDTKVQTTEVRNNIVRLQERNYEILGDMMKYSPNILAGVSIGYDLGLMLSGYLFPTYMNINEPYIFADNIEYDKRDKKTTDIKSQFDKEGFSEEPKSIPATIKEYEPLNISRIVKPISQTFKPVKHGKRPLTYIEIQELKSTLNKNELNDLKNKFLYFDEDKLKMDKSNDKCRNVIQETQIPKRKVF
tara:strand:+ start:3059 stop:5938 length:2880 start_codon:yes stop_codon:yes gene_type:complete